jgi:hypothetical protein
MANYIPLPVNDDAMRGTLLVVVLFLLLAPACSATQPIVPALALTMEPSSATVASPPNDTVAVTFNGTATVDKAPFVRITVTLQATVGAGWPVSLSPSTMVFTSLSSQPFSCMVSVPQSTPSTTTNLTVEGKAVGGGFQSQPATATSIITVQGTTGTNKTGGTGGTGKTGTNQTTGGGTGPSGTKTTNIGPIDIKTLGLLAGVIAIVAGGSGGYMFLKRRKARRQAEDGPEEMVEDVSAE